MRSNSLLWLLQAAALRNGVRAPLAQANSISAGFNHDASVAEEPIFEPSSSEVSLKRVAIIGAGSGGASAAYYLAQYAADAGVPTNITVFERNGFIGGRSTTVNAYEDESQPVELGASIFVEMNRILFEAAERFNLSTSSAEDDIYERVWKWEDDPENQLKKCQSDEAYTVSPFLGIWNGEAFVYTQKSASLGIWDFAKLLWRYGTAPLRANRLTKEVINRFLRLYEDPLFPWVSLTDAVRVVGLDTVTTKTAESLFKQRGMWGEFAREIVQASTRVNYAQHLSAIHSLESLVCLATEGAMAVRGGNWQMFDAMIHEATRDVRLNTSVTAVEYNSDGLYSVASTSPHSSDIEHFDDVIIATPLQFSGIDINSPSARLPDTIPYVQLHVTLFSTPRALSPSAFNLSGSESVPTFVLTTLQPDEDPGDDLEYGAGKAGFFSISVVKKGRNPHSLPPGRPERIYKIFSDKRVDDAFLARILGVEEPSSESCERDENEDPHRFCGLDENDVSWIHRKVWHSYPFELPRVTFEELRLGESLWYTSGIESFISTMETSALAGKNIAKLVVNEWVKSPETEKTEL